MPAKGGGGSGGSSIWLVTMLCFASFCVTAFVTKRMAYILDIEAGRGGAQLLQKEQRGTDACDTGPHANYEDDERKVLSEFSKLNSVTKRLNETVESLKTELAVAYFDSQKSRSHGTPVSETDSVRRKAFVVVGINTGFTSQKRRYALRSTWMPQGDELRRLEEEKGVVIKFVIGRHGSISATSFPDLLLDDENARYNDILRLDHVEGYKRLTTKTKIFIATAFAKWDAQFYVKVDDDIHLNVGALVSRLGEYVTLPRAYIGCMITGPVLTRKSNKYYEPEFLKFGDKGNKYFKHATGQMYAISNALASYVAVNLPILHEYANEDVSLGSWLLGLDVEQIDDRSMCCGSPPQCELRQLVGQVCVGIFDWECSGVCETHHMKAVHNRCGEPEGSI